jgi:hypothetical protein
MTRPETGRGDGEGLPLLPSCETIKAHTKAERKMTMRMLTLKEFYEPAEKMPAEISPDVQKRTKDIDSDALQEISRLVAIMTEAHLTCSLKICRGAKMCCCNSTGPHASPCRAPMTRQRIDMNLAIVTFLALAGTSATLRDMQEEKKQAESAAAEKRTRESRYY